MQKLLLMLVVGGLVGTPAVPAFACGGGGGGGCSMSGGSYGGGRAVAYGKVGGRAPMLAQAGSRVTPQPAKPTTALVDAHNRIASPAVRTVAAKAKTADKAKAVSPIYTCPIHPQVQWTKPTDCPICGMKLKLKQKADATKRAGVGDEHAGMQMDNMGDMQGMNHDEMSGMDDMQMCPGCMMNMGGMSGMKGKQGSATGQEASGGRMRLAGMGCGC